MYIVRDQKTKEVIHVNPAPLSQELIEKEIYYNYDSKTMEIIKTDLSDMPENYKIDSNGNIVELSLNEQVEAGIIKLGQECKIIDNQIVEKTISEKITDGLITLLPSQKVVGSGIQERIVNKTPSELVNEGIIELSPFQKIIGSGENELIVEKNLEEQLNEGILKLGPNQRIVDNKVVTYTPKELYDQGLIDIDEYKRRIIEEFSEQAFVIRNDIIPDYQLINSALNIYEESVRLNIEATVQAFRDEFYNLKRKIEEATTVKEIQNIKENYPREMVIVSNSK